MSGLIEVQTVRHFSDITSLNFASMMHPFVSISTEGSLLRCNMIWFVVISAAEMGHDICLSVFLSVLSIYYYYSDKSYMLYFLCVIHISTEIAFCYC